MSENRCWNSAEFDHVEKVFVPLLIQRFSKVTNMLRSSSFILSCRFWFEHFGYLWRKFMALCFIAGFYVVLCCRNVSSLYWVKSSTIKMDLWIICRGNMHHFIILFFLKDQYHQDFSFFYRVYIVNRIWGQNAMKFDANSFLL